MGTLTRDHTILQLHLLRALFLEAIAYSLTFCSKHVFLCFPKSIIPIANLLTLLIKPGGDKALGPSPSVV